MLPVEVKRIKQSHKGVCLGVVVSEQDVVTLWGPTCGEGSEERATPGSLRCRISTLWLGLRLTVLNGCLAHRLEGKANTPNCPLPTQSQK